MNNASLPHHNSIALTVMRDKQRQILVTSALPYANGPIHIGHMVEYIQTDIWVRFQKMRGHQCVYICADDSHGTPIMLKAQEKGTSPETLIEQMKNEHERDFNDFAITFDNYHSTHSKENQSLANSIFKKLNEGGHITKRVIKQLYDPEKNMFLPDRFIRGECPKCHAVNQYGDNCEVCGATYAPTDLINPISAITGKKPIEKESEHYFFKLHDFEENLLKWTHEGHLQNEVTNKLDEWFEAGLQEWDISRDEPYFGFKIPGTTNKFFYVWLDAPIGYLASFKNFCEKEKLDFNHWCDPNSDIEMYHFIGKDIIYFHALFWPAILEGSNLKKPSAVYAHGFLTVEGQKMSKSRGTFITARSYLNHLNPEYLRYYIAAKLGPGIDDIDLNLDDFLKRVNSDLIGKVINIASRCAGFINKRFDGQLSPNNHDTNIQSEFANQSEQIENAYENREYAIAMREIMTLADKANQYIDYHKPWIIAKQKNSDNELQSICTTGINLYRVLALYLKPVLPIIAKNTEEFLNIEPLNWKDAKTTLLDHKINKYSPLMTRIEKEKIKDMLVETKENDISKN